MTNPPGSLSRPDPPVATRKASLVIGAYYLLAALAVRLLPPRYWGVLPDLLARYQTRRPTAKSLAFARRFRALQARDGADAPPAGWQCRHEAANHQRVIYVAALRRRREWNPEISLAGLERLQEARARGRGVILWTDPFVHAAIIGKRALAGAGIRPWHLSFTGHGLLNTAFANRHLNPRMIEVEMRYLAGRVVFGPRSTTGATREILRILDSGGVVSMTNNAYIGRTVETPFAGGLLRLARTPLHLAASRGIPLLPLRVIECERFARYEVTIGPDLGPMVASGADDPIQALARIYADYLLPLAIAEPAQFAGWMMMRAPVEFTPAGTSPSPA